MKKRKYLAIIAAPLLTISLVIATNFTAHSDVVKAASDEAAETITFTKVPTLKFKVGAYQGFQTVADWLKGVKVSDGYVKATGDIGDFDDVKFYKNDANGEPMMDWPLDWNDFKNGDEGTALVYVRISRLKPLTYYRVLCQKPWHGKKGNVYFQNGALYWRNMETDTYGDLWSVGGTPSSDEPSCPVIKAHFVVGSKKKAVKKSKAKSYRRVYVKVRKNRRVRTYTSSGRFSKHYVYGHHTYKVNSKKHVRRHGTCYKIYGKNQWIPAKYLRLR